MGQQSSFKYTALGSALVLLVAAGTMAVSAANKPATPPTASSANQQTLKQMLGFKVPQRCTMSYKTPSGNIDGIIYIGAGNMRGDFTALAASSTAKTHMVVKNSKDAYSWLDGMATGYKTTIDAMSKPQAGSASVNPDQKNDVKCATWKVDKSVFNLPTNVKFTTTTAVKSNVGAKTGATTPSAIPQVVKPTNLGMPTDLIGQACAACNSLPAASIAQCKAVYCK